MTIRRLMILLVSLFATGCSRDEELTRMAEQTVAAQREQNRAMSQHNQKVIETTRELAETAEQLVEKDAEARREMVVAHKEMRTELHTESVSIGRQRENLEQERQAIAKERVTQPIIAEAIQAAALLLAALLPLALAGYVLASARNSDDQAAVAELLVLDLTSEQPQLLPSRPELLQMEGPGSQTALPGPDAKE